MKSVSPRTLIFGIKHSKQHLQISKWNAKGGKKWLGRTETQSVAMETKLLSSYCGAHFVETHCKESNFSETNFIIFDQNLIECMTSSLGQFARFKNLNISGMKRDI